MSEYLSSERYHEYRVRTLANNLSWLSSFGCQITHHGDIVSVQHPELPEYNAHLIIGSAEETLAPLKSLLAGLRPDSFVYLDEAFSTDAIRSVLTSHGLSPVLTSQVKLARIKPILRSTDMQLQLARPNDMERWSTLYSKGFARSGKDAAVDRDRWQRSFRCPEILHWFFVRHGRDVGVCQTCIANGVVGVYSLALSVGDRSVGTVISVVQSLRAEMLQRLEEIIYFERVKNRAPTELLKPVRYSSFKIIRTFLAYKKT